MFRGSSHHTIDAKGRINIPSRFRELIRDGGGSGVILAGPGLPERCLAAYAYSSWDEVEQKILALVEKTPAMKRFMRIFLGNAHDCPFDKQGRVLIPPPLRKYAGLEKDIVLAGVLPL